MFSKLYSIETTTFPKLIRKKARNSMKLLTQFLNLFLILLGFIAQSNATLGILNPLGVLGHKNVNVGYNPQIGTGNIDAGITGGLSKAGSLIGHLGAAKANLGTKLVKGFLEPLNTNVGSSGDCDEAINANLGSNTKKTECKSCRSDNESKPSDMEANLNTGINDDDKNIKLTFSHSKSVKNNVGSTKSKLKYEWSNDSSEEENESDNNFSNNESYEADLPYYNIKGKQQISDLLNKKIKDITKILRKLKIKKEVLADLESSLNDLKEIALNRVVCNDEVNIERVLHYGSIKKELGSSTRTRISGTVKGKNDVKVGDGDGFNGDFRFYV